MESAGAIALSDVKSVTFHVADQKGSVTLKVYNGGDDAEAANTQYGLTGSEEYTMEPSGEGSVDAVGLMTTDETGSGSEVSLISVTFELKEGSGSRLPMAITSSKTAISQATRQPLHGMHQLEIRRSPLRKRRTKSVTAA